MKNQKKSIRTLINQTFQPHYGLESSGTNCTQSRIQTKNNLLSAKACLDWVKQALHPEYLSLTRKIRAIKYRISLEPRNEMKNARNNFMVQEASGIEMPKEVFRTWDTCTEKNEIIKTINEKPEYKEFNPISLLSGLK